MSFQTIGTVLKKIPHFLKTNLSNCRKCGIFFKTVPIVWNDIRGKNFKFKRASAEI
jgi:hypothetical protein